MRKPLDRDVLAGIGPDALIGCGYNEHCLKQWKYRGIPWKERAKVAEIAERRGVEVPSDFLHSQRPIPDKQKRRAA